MKLTWTTFKPNGRRFYYVQWVNPDTGRKETRSTKATKKRDADDFARKLVERIESLGDPASRTAWASFLAAHLEEVQPAIASNTASLYRTAFNSLSRFLHPRDLSDLTARNLSRYAAALRTDGRSEETIRCYLAHLRTSLKWAKGQGMIATVPEFPALRRSKGRKLVKGRAVTGEEFERMLSAVEPELIEAKRKKWKGTTKGWGAKTTANLPAAVASVQRLLRGLYLGGLRLSEAMALRDGGDVGLRADLDRDPPVLRIEAEDEKGGRDRVLPLTPDFAEFLRTIRPTKLGQPFFELQGVRRAVTDMRNVSALISRIGKRANIKVREKSGRVKWASAHDLRRSFGTRWAARLDKPRDLQLLMRHSEIQTTLAYYVFDDADELSVRIAQAARADLANTPANTRPAASDRRVRQRRNPKRRRSL